jgi:hypothetical protein
LSQETKHRTKILKNKKMKTTIKNLKLSLAAIIACTFTSTLSFGQAGTGTKLPLSVSIQATNPSCNGSNDGNLFFTVSGGFPPYYLNGNVITNDTVSMTSLAEGTYDFTFTDESLAMAEGTAVLFAPQAPSIMAVVSDVTTISPNGSVDLTVVSAYGAVSYEWESFSPMSWNPTDEDQFALPQGIYLAKITESNGCQFIKRFEINTNISGGNTSNMVLNDDQNEEAANSSMILYPNPSSGEFQIRSEKVISQVLITNELGQIMINDSNPTETGKYELKPGKYTVVGLDSDNNTTRSHITIR